MKNRLKVLRAENNWSQEDLAHKTGVSRQTINAIEAMAISDADKKKIYEGNARTLMRLPI